MICVTSFIHPLPFLLSNENCTVEKHPLHQSEAWKAIWLIQDAIFSCDKKMSNLFFLLNEWKPFLTFFSFRNSKKLKESQEEVSKHCQYANISTDLTERGLLTLSPLHVWLPNFVPALFVCCLQHQAGYKSFLHFSWLCWKVSLILRSTVYMAFPLRHRVCCPKIWVSDLCPSCTHCIALSDVISPSSVYLLICIME